MTTLLAEGGAIDFQFDQTMDGRTLKFLNVIDEFSRVCLAIRVGRRCKAVDVIDTIEELLKLYPPPTHQRMDNGPEFIAHALQEWCTGSYRNGVHPARLTLGEPIYGVIQWPIQGRVPVGGAGRRPYIKLFASVQEAKLLAEQQWGSRHNFIDLGLNSKISILK